MVLSPTIVARLEKNEPGVHLNPQDIEGYVGGRLDAIVARFIHHHLLVCQDCREGLLRVIRAADRAAVATYGSADGERRRDGRIRVNDFGQLRLLDPFELGLTEICVLDVSRSGLKIRAPRELHRGCVVQVILGELLILASTVHCRPVEGAFTAGLRMHGLLKL